MYALCQRRQQPKREAFFSLGPLVLRLLRGVLRPLQHALPGRQAAGHSLGGPRQTLLRALQLLGHGGVACVGRNAAFPRRHVCLRCEDCIVQLAGLHMKVKRGVMSDAFLAC